MRAKVILALSLLMVFTANCSAEGGKKAGFESIFVVHEGIGVINDRINSALLKSRFSFKQSTSRSAGVYFDTPELDLLDSNGYLRFDALEYLSTKKKKLKFHETIQYSTESRPFYQLRVKHYKTVKTFEGKHPLIGLIKRKERPAFMQVLHFDGFKYPLKFKEIAKVSRISYQYQLRIAGHDVAIVSISEIKSSAFEHNFHFNIINLQFSDNKLTDKYLTELSELLFMAADIGGAQVFSNEYSALYSQLTSHISYFNLLLKYPFLVTLVYSLLVGLFGGFVVWVVFRLREKT